MDVNDRVRELLKGQPGVRHAKLVCLITNAWYHGSTARRGGAWMDQYTCPECGRQGKFLANYLGQRKVKCDGIKFTKETD